MLIDSSDYILKFISLFLEQWSILEFPHISLEFGLSWLLHRGIWWSVNLHCRILRVVLLQNPATSRLTTCNLISSKCIGLQSFTCVHAKLVWQGWYTCSSLNENIWRHISWNCCWWLLRGFIGRCLAKGGIRLRLSIASKHHIRSWKRGIVCLCK